MAGFPKMTVTQDNFTQRSKWQKTPEITASSSPSQGGNLKCSICAKSIQDKDLNHESSHGQQHFGCILEWLAENDSWCQNRIKDLTKILDEPSIYKPSKEEKEERSREVQRGQDEAFRNLLPQNQNQAYVLECCEKAIEAVAVRDGGADYRDALWRSEDLFVDNGRYWWQWGQDIENDIVDDL